MTQRFDAIFENGVFRPEKPVNIPEGQRVSLTVEAKVCTADELVEVVDLLDVEFTQSCRAKGETAPSLVSVREMLASFQGSLADRIGQERDER